MPRTEMKEETAVKKKKKVARKNVEVRSNVKARFDEIAQKETESYESVSVLSLLRDSLSRLLTLWWLSKTNAGTFSIQFPGEDDAFEVVNRLGILSITPDILDLKDADSYGRDRINLSIPIKLLEELEEISIAQDKALTVVMRDSFHLELLLHQIYDQQGKAFFTLKNGVRVNVVDPIRVYNYAPGELKRLGDAIPEPVS